MKVGSRTLRTAFLVVVAALAASCVLAPAASADDFLVGLWGKARIGSFVETWQGDDPANLEASFGAPDSSEYKSDGYACEKRWDGLGMKVDLWTFGIDGTDACEGGMFGRAQLTSPMWHTSNGISPGGSAKSARKKAIARCSNKPRRYCGTKGYILSTHLSECAGGRVPSVVARVRGSKVTSLIVFTSGCE